MFQYYKKLLFSNIALYSVEQGGGDSGQERFSENMKKIKGTEEGSGGPQNRYDAFNKAKLETVKVELAKLGDTAKVAELEKVVEGIHGDTRAEAGKILLDRVVSNYFSTHPNMTEGKFKSALLNNAIEFEDGTWDDKDSLDTADVVILEKYGITQEQVIAALNTRIPNQRIVNHYDSIVESERAAATEKDIKASDERLIARAREGEEKSRLASMEKAYASMPADARSQDIAKTTATIKLADLLKGGDIKFSEFKKNPDAVEALQIALAALDFDIGTTGPNKNGVDKNYGPKTEKAVAAFQKSLGGKINVDGDSGTATLTALLEKTQSLPQNTKTLMADTPELKNPDIKTA